MGLTLADRPVHRLSVDDVSRMLESGILTDDTPVELLDGVLVEMSPKSPEHTAVLTLLDRWLLPVRVAGRHHVRTGQPLAVPAADSLPEPDLAVVERGADLDRHPTTALLVVEIAIGSYASDTTVKSALYASADVPDYWVVDVARGRVEVRREPLGHEFRRTEILGTDDRVAPLRLDLAPLEIAALLRR